MNRKRLLKMSAKSGFGCCAGVTLDAIGTVLPASPLSTEETPEARQDGDFVRNWLADMLQAMETYVDREVQVKLMEVCGRRCFERHDFMQNIARQGNGNLQKLLEAYKTKFEVSQEGNLVHIRFGKALGRCCCPAANYRPSKANDIHCECSRSTHQTIFETALGRPFKVDIVETLRRGGKSCHFRVHLA